MKLKKVLIIIIVMLIFLILFCNTTCMAKVITDNYRPGKFNASENARIFEIGGKIVTVLKTVGTVIAVVGIIVIGIKYMLGSVEQKAEYKKTMVPYVVGCIMLFAIGQIVSIIYNIVSKV